MHDNFNMVDFANGILRQQRDLGLNQSDVILNIAPKTTEKYEMFKSRNKEFVQYEYTHTNGESFYMIGYSLQECREFRNEWINNGCKL
jgi:hypothetical protein